MAETAHKLIIPTIITMAESDGASALPSPGRSQAGSSDPGSSPQFLCVDETKRPRANSDPVGLHICISPVPEIRVTGEDGTDEDATGEESDSFLIPPSPRRRANTCPEDMFRSHKGRPPTPPPTDIHILKGPSGKRFSFNFAPKDLNGISFAHHKLSKVSEEKPEQQPLKETSLCNKNRANERKPGPSSCLASGGSRDNTHFLQKTPVLSSHTDEGMSRLGNGRSEQIRTEDCSCDPDLSNRMGSMSVKVDSSNNNDKRESPDSANEVISRPSDSYRPKDTCRDNVDSGRLRAY